MGLWMLFATVCPQVNLVQTLSIIIPEIKSPQLSNQTTKLLRPNSAQNCASQMMLHEIGEEWRIEEEFSSHDFIQEYCRQYETEYLDWLMEYHGSGKAFQTVHGLIGKYLSEHHNDLHIAPIGKHDSECIHGTIDRPMWWQWER